MDSNLEWAIAYAGNGFAVFPCGVKSKAPATGHGVKDGTTDIKQIKMWWATNRNYNIGCRLGKASGVVGIDVDTIDGKCNPFLSQLPPGYRTLTPTGGAHPYFRYPERYLQNNKTIAIGATIRTEGYYLVLPPSIHPNGKPYGCLNDIPLWKGEIPDLPDWIIDHPGIVRSAKDIRPIGERHNALLNYAVAMRKDGKDENHIVDKLLIYNQKRLIEAKPVKEIEEIIYWVMSHVSVMPEGNANAVLSEAGGLILDENFKQLISDEVSLVYEITSLEQSELKLIRNPDCVAITLAEEVEKREGQRPDVKQLKSIVGQWKFKTNRLTDIPPSFGWVGENNWVIKRLNFIPHEGPFPAWGQFLNRLSAPEDFMAFVWSIFETENKARQFLYLVDPRGEGGKSTVIRVLGGVLGQAFCALSNQMVSGDALRWLPSMLFDKRLAGWSDCKNPKFCMGELIRNITSGDPIVVEEKGKPPFTAQVQLKLIIGSNQEPEISNEGANTSRLIRINVAENSSSKNCPEWENQLKVEIPYFLFECQKWYREKCPNHGNLSLSSTSHGLISDSSILIDARYEEIIDRRIEIGPGFEATPTEWENFIKEERLNNYEVGKIKALLERENHGSVLIKRDDTRGNNPRRGRVRYLGFRIRGAFLVGEFKF